MLLYFKQFSNNSFSIVIRDWRLKRITTVPQNLDGKKWILGRGSLSSLLKVPVYSLNIAHYSWVVSLSHHYGTSEN